MIIADVLVEMNVIDARGTTLTAAMVTSGLYGNISSVSLDTTPITGFVIGDHKYECPDDVQIGSTVYPSRGRYSRAMAFNHNQTVRTVVITIPGAPVRYVCSVGCLIYFGPKNDGASGSLFDYISIETIPAANCVLQLNNGNGTGGTYALNIESNPGGSTTHSAYLTISPFTWYWVNLAADFYNGVGKFAVFDTTTWLQVGSTITATLDVAVLDSDRAVDTIHFGNGEVGTASSGTTISFFEHLLIDYTSARFPLLPRPNRASAVERLSRTSTTVRRQSEGATE